MEIRVADLPAVVWERIADTVAQVETDTGWQYETDLAVAPEPRSAATRTGRRTPTGRTATAAPGWSICSRSRAGSSGRGDGIRWIPIEEARRCHGSGRRLRRDHPSRAVQNPTGLMLGDAGGIYLFTCPTVPTVPRSPIRLLVTVAFHMYMARSTPPTSGANAAAGAACHPAQTTDT